MCCKAVHARQYRCDSRAPSCSHGWVWDRSYLARIGKGAMNFVDRMLRCSDCGIDFIFTAGEQLFFVDRQFKNDPKRCKLCKARRAGLGKTADGTTVALAALPLSRTETRTECSACGLETTVPFKPTQGRPVFCRSCFQLKRVPAAVAVVAGLESPLEAAEAAEVQAIAHSAHPSPASSIVESIAGMPSAALVSPDSHPLSMEMLSAEIGQA